MPEWHARTVLNSALLGLRLWLLLSKLQDAENPGIRYLPELLYWAKLITLQASQN